MDIALNPNLQIDALQASFKRSNRLRVDEIFQSSTADALVKALRTDVAWKLVCRDAGKPKEIEEREFLRMSSQQRSKLIEHVYSTAVSGDYQFLFYWSALNAEHMVAFKPESEVVRAVEFLQGHQFLRFVEDVTGIGKLERVTAYATCYRAGHFLLCHDDGDGDTARKLAYVLNLSPVWQSGWGGLLQFHDSGGDVVEAYLPRFNSLSLFQVPVTHSVSCVAPFVVDSRIAISGWIYR